MAPDKSAKVTPVKVTKVKDPSYERKFPNDAYHHPDDAYREALMYAARNVTILSRRCDDWNGDRCDYSNMRSIKPHAAVLVALTKVLTSSY